MKRAAFHYGDIALADFENYLKELHSKASATVRIKPPSTDNKSLIWVFRIKLSINNFSN